MKLETIQLITTLIAFFMAITFHEFAHALAAHLLGDDTAERAGRLTLNPFKHIDPFGLLFLFLFRIGWAKPVPMNMDNFKYPRLYAVLSAFAGPFANLLLALVSLYLLKYFPANLLPATGALFFIAFFKNSAQMNVMLGVFNLLPIPPLDGGHLIHALIPEESRMTYYRLMPVFIIVLLIFLMFSQGLLINAMNAVLGFLQKLVI